MKSLLYIPYTILVIGRISMQEQKKTIKSG